MADPIGEIPVVISGDYSDLQQALSIAEGLAKASGLKIAQIFTSAGGVYAAGATAVAAFAGSAFDAALQFDEAFDHIRSSTGATGSSLVSLEESFKNVFQNVPADAKKVADAIGEVAQRTGLMGEPLERLSEQLLNLSHMTGQAIAPLVQSATRLFGDWSVSTDRQNEALDTLFKTTQLTGIEFGKLTELVVQFGAPMRALGFDLQEAAALMGKWEKEGVNLQTVLAGLKFALGNFAKAGVEPAEAFREVVASIKATDDETKGLAITFDTFGKRAATDMFRAIKEGKLDIDALVASIQKSGETIQQATIDTRSFGEQWTILSNRITTGLAAIGKPMLAVVNSTLDMVLNLNDVDKAFDKFDDWQSSTKGVSTDFAVLNERFRQGALAGKSFADIAKSIPPVMRAASTDSLDFGLSVKMLGDNTKKANPDLEETPKHVKKIGDSSRAAKDEITKFGNELRVQFSTAIPSARELAEATLSIQSAAMQSALAIGHENDALNNLKAIADQTRATLADMVPSEISTELEGVNEGVQETEEQVGELEVSVKEASVAVQEMNRIWDQANRGIASGIADVILEGKSLGEVFSNIAKQIARDIIETIVEGALNRLKDAILKNTDLLGGFGDVFRGIFGGGGAGSVGDIAGGVASGLPGGALGTIGDVAGSAGGTAGSIAGAAGQAAGNSVSAIVGAVGSIASAVSGIIGNFQFMGMNKSLDIIVLHTLQTANDLANLRFDEWTREAHMMLKLDDLWRTLLNIYDFMGANLAAPLQVMGVPGLSPAVAGASLDSAGMLSGGNRASVYVNAVNPDARSVTKALVRGLEEVGIKVR